MDEITTLSQLTNEDLRRYSAWEATGDYAEDVDAKLTPVKFDDDGRVPVELEEVWCMCIATFSDGSEHMASSMCRGDSSDGPLLCTVWNGSDNVELLVPPAPPHVLEKHGPDYFSAKFNMKKGAIFPLTIKVVPRFTTKPEIRSAIFEETGKI